MQILLILLAALAPVAILLWYIYFKDSLQPEPTRLLIKAFWFGVLSVFVVFVTVFPLQLLTGFGLDESETISGAFVNAFVLQPSLKKQQSLSFYGSFCVKSIF